MKKSVHKVNKLQGKKKPVQKRAKKTISRKASGLKAKSLVKAKAKTKAKLKFRIKAEVKTKVKTKAKAQASAMVLRQKHHKPLVMPTSKKPVLVTVKNPKSQAVQVKKRERAVFGPVDVKPYQLKENEDYMSKKQLEHFREVLLHWKSELMFEVGRTVQNMQEVVSNYPDPVDRASQEEEFSLELRARDRERKLLRKIEETLNRINDNDYGYCDDCGAEIGIRRLEVRPTATQCIECKTIAEIKEKQVGDGDLR